MSSLLFTLVVGIGLLGWMLAVLLRGAPQEVAPAAYGRMAQVVPLPGLNFPCPERLFDAADYEAARAAGFPPAMTNAIGPERRRLALLWLRLLRKDVQTLWQLRRMMAAHGISAGPGEELRVALAGVAALSLIQMLRVALVVAGPFGAGAICQASRRGVESIWRGCAGLFYRIPEEQVGEFERQWTASLPAAETVFVR